MPSIGDRVVFEGIKVGGGRREGELVSVVGRGVRVRWPDGSESFLIPGPGAMSVVGKTAPAQPRRPASKKSVQQRSTAKAVKAVKAAKTAKAKAKKAKKR
jgi:uncharacterized protein DUF1918